MKSNMFINLFKSNLWQVKNKLYSVYSFCCFPCSWISFLCLYFSNNCSILFFYFIVSKDSLLFMINSILCFKFSSTSLGQSKLKQNVLGPLVTVIFSSVMMMTWLNCCKLFWWLYYTDTKDTVFVWFHFLICMNCF